MGGWLWTVKNLINDRFANQLFPSSWTSWVVWSTCVSSPSSTLIVNKSLLILIQVAKWIDMSYNAQGSGKTRTRCVICFPNQIFSARATYRPWAISKEGSPFNGCVSARHFTDITGDFNRRWPRWGTENSVYSRIGWQPTRNVFLAHSLFETKLGPERISLRSVFAAFLCCLFFALRSSITGW